ncbi:OVALX protein, partial [Oceanites oceanicus]|nr:OVALX protein [Oceanites oceanicus]
QIQDFLVSGSVDLDTVLVLVNAIYFKGIWKMAFKEEHTREVPFNVTEQESRPVQMMCQNSTFKVAAVAAEKMKILELPYASGELSMLVLLPDDSLKISEAVHEAYMEVNEEGTEMAGSEGVMGDIKYSSDFEEFRADHPFLFLIKHNPTNIILFFGKYCSP